MTSIITGDIIKSRKLKTSEWMEGFKAFLSTFGNNPNDWEIYRGDEFQLEVKNPKEAFITAILIKTYLKSVKLDARMSIGIGDKNYDAKKISESNGAAFVYSGETFENLKKQKNTLAIQTNNNEFNLQMNLLFKLGVTFIDGWLSQSVEFVISALQNPNLSQEELGQKLNINQAAVSRRRKRAQFDLLLELNDYYKSQVELLNK
ncbi:MAG: SatD family protein [Bacteroidota bacterium]